MSCTLILGELDASRFPPHIFDLRCFDFQMFLEAVGGILVLVEILVVLGRILNEVADQKLETGKVHSKLLKYSNSRDSHDSHDLHFILSNSGTESYSNYHFIY